MKFTNLLAVVLVFLGVLVPVSSVGAGEFPIVYYDLKTADERITPFEIGISTTPFGRFVRVRNRITGETKCDVVPLVILDQTRAFFPCALGNRTVTIFLEITSDGSIVWSVTFPGGNFFSGFLCPQPE